MADLIMLVTSETLGCAFNPERQLEIC